MELFGRYERFFLTLSEEVNSNKMMLMNHRKMGLCQGRVNNTYAIPQKHFLIFSESSSDEDFTNS